VLGSDVDLETSNGDVLDTYTWSLEITPASPGARCRRDRDDRSGSVQQRFDLHPTTADGADPPD
jgi:hypothetical protein